MARIKVQINSGKPINSGTLKNIRQLYKNTKHVNTSARLHGEKAKQLNSYKNHNHVYATKSNKHCAKNGTSVAMLAFALCQKMKTQQDGAIDEHKRAKYGQSPRPCDSENNTFLHIFRAG